MSRDVLVIYQRSSLRYNAQSYRSPTTFLCSLSPTPPYYNSCSKSIQFNSCNICHMLKHTHVPRRPSFQGFVLVLCHQTNTKDMAEQRGKHASYHVKRLVSLKKRSKKTNKYQLMSNLFTVLNYYSSI